MNIFRREFKANLRSLIIWSVSMLFLVASGMAKFANAEAAGGQSFNDMIKLMPKAVQVVLGIGGLDMNKASGAYGVLFFYIAIMAAIQASLLGADIIAKEEQEKTSEFLFVKPSSRERIVTSKLLYAILNIIIINLVTLVSSLLIVNHYSKGENIVQPVLVLMAGMFFLQLIFLSIGSAIAAIVRKSAGSIATAILLASFFLSVAIDMSDKIERLRWLTPFKYFDAKNLVNDGRLDATYTIISVLLIGVMIACTYVFYRKRDLNT